MRVFTLLPYERWPPLTAVTADSPATDVADNYVRARPTDVLPLLEARIEWLEAASGPLAERELPPTMYRQCPHCGYKWRMQVRTRASTEAVLRCPNPDCRVSYEAGHIIGPCRHCGESWRQKGPGPPAYCPRCNKVRPVLAASESGDSE